MLSVSEFSNSFNKNQLVIKISVQIDDYIEFDYPSGSHIHFDDDSVTLTNCKVSSLNYLFIIEGTTKTGQEIKLFWGENYFDLLQNMYLNIPRITCYLHTFSVSTSKHFPNPNLCVQPRNKQIRLLKKNIYIKMIIIITHKK